MVAFGPLTIGAGVFVAAVTSGATGQAFPLIAGPFFLLVYPVPEAVGLTAMCSLTGQLFSIAMLRQLIEYQFVGRLIGAGLIGVPLGTELLTDCDPHVVRIVLGLLILLSGVWGLVSPRALSPKFGSRLAEAVVGLCGGLTGGLVGASSVVPAIWCAARGLSKERLRAITQPYIMTMQIASLVSLAARGMVDAQVAGAYAVYLMPLLMGICIGVAGFRMMSSRTARFAVMSIVAASGLALLLV